MEETNFFNLSIGRVVEGYRNNTITPAGVAEICLRQFQRLESRFLAWVRFDEDLLMMQAHASEEWIRNGNPIRELEGIPIGVKDIMNTTEFPTEMGSPIWKDFTPGNDARVVYYLKMAGAAIPGKTVTAEFAVHTPGDTLNPHDLSRTPGTSSSGSAVAVALGMVQAAIGTQTAGSIVRPSSFCGIYGCKPSFGFIPRTGILKTTDSLDTVGYFVLHYEDIRRLFNVLKVHGPNYPLSNAALNDKKRQTKPSDRPWNVAFAKTHTWEYAPAYAQNAIMDWLKRLSETDDIVTESVALPPIMEKSHTVHSAIYDKTLSYYFRDEFKQGTLVSPIMRDLILHGNSLSVDQYQNALGEQEKMAVSMDEFLKEYDVIVSLSTAGEAPMRNELEQPDPGLIWTMTHLPVVSAPAFVSPGGLPFGVQIVARKYNDYLLFEFCDYIRQKGLIPEKSNPVLQVE